MTQQDGPAAHDLPAPAIAKPSGITRGTFNANGLEAGYAFVRAERERRIIVGLTGLNSKTVFSLPLLKELRENGISVIWLILPEWTQNKQLIDPLRDICRAFLTNVKSPWRSMDKSLSHDLAVHSVSGQILLSLMHERDTNHSLSAAFQRALYMAPYFDFTGASLLKTPQNRVAFETYASQNANAPASWQTFAGTNVPLADKGLHQDNMPSILPTFGTILTLNQEGRRLLRKLNPDEARAVEPVFIIGDQDPVACPFTAQEIARKMNADIILIEGAGHEPLKNPDTHKPFINMVLGTGYQAALASP